MTRPVEIARRVPGARLRLFCFPYAGGSAAVYRDWHTLVPGEIEVAAVNLPGRGARFKEPPLDRAEVLVESLAEELGPHMEPPFAFFGHSMGALIAFELTRLLRREGRRLPERLLVSGRRAPHLPDEDPPIHGLPDAELMEELRQLNGTPEEVLAHPELMELFLPVLRADFAVCEEYRYREEPPLDLPISAFGGVDDPDVERSHVLGWREQTRGGFRLRMFPGGHFFLNDHRDALVRAVVLDLLSGVPL